jgi:hypothetical protein
VGAGQGGAHGSTEFGGCMVAVWWLYGGCLVVVWWLYGGCMVVLKVETPPHLRAQPELPDGAVQLRQRGRLAQGGRLHNPYLSL